MKNRYTFVALKTSNNLKKSKMETLKKQSEANQLRNFKETQNSHKLAKQTAKSLGGCLNWVISNNTEFSELAKRAQSKENYEILKATVKPNVKTGLFNAYAVTLALRKLEFIFS